jgi:hypothetical protein
MCDVALDGQQGLPAAVASVRMLQVWQKSEHMFVRFERICIRLLFMSLNSRPNLDRCDPHRLCSCPTYLGGSLHQVVEQLQVMHHLSIREGLMHLCWSGPVACVYVMDAFALLPLFIDETRTAAYTAAIALVWLSALQSIARAHEGAHRWLVK